MSHVVWSVLDTCVISETDQDAMWGGVTHVGPRNHLLRGIPDGKGHFWGVHATHCKKTTRVDAHYSRAATHADSNAAFCLITSDTLLLHVRWQTFGFMEQGPDLQKVLRQT